MSRLINALKRLEDGHTPVRAEAVLPSPVSASPVEPVVTQPVSVEQPVPEQSIQKIRSPEPSTPQQSVSEPSVSEQGRAEAVEPAPSTPQQFDSPFKSRTVQELAVLPDGRAELIAPVSLRSIVAARPSPVHDRVSEPVSQRATPAEPPTPVAPRVDTPAPPEITPETEAVAHDAKTAPDIKPEPVASLPDSVATVAPADDDQRVSGDERLDAGLDERLDGGLLDVCDNIFSLLPHDDRAILAFASVSEDDAHAVAVQQLAMTMAAELEDAVLVVDGSPDLAFSHAVGVRNAPRLDELATGRSDWQESVVQTTTPGLCVLPLSGDPTTSAGSAGVRRLLAEIAEQYRCILIDLGGCESPLCSTLLSGCDGAVLMVESGASPVDEVVSALRNLSGFRTQVLGVLLVKRQMAA